MVEDCDDIVRAPLPYAARDRVRGEEHPRVRRAVHGRRLGIGQVARRTIPRRSVVGEVREHEPWCVAEIGSSILNKQAPEDGAARRRSETKGLGATLALFAPQDNGAAPIVARLPIP